MAEDLVGAALRQLAGLLKDRTVESKIDFTEPALVGRFDFVQTLRILTNLLANASQHTPRESPIELSVHREGETLVRSEEHTSELQSRLHLVCRLLLEKKKNKE